MPIAYLRIMGSLLDQFDEIAVRIIDSGLSDYDKIKKDLNLNNYMVPRLFKVIEEFPLSIYRARPASDFDYWDKAQFRHPPPESCKLMGRANFTAHPVFYGAFSAETAIRELMIQDRRIKNDDKVFISEWKLTYPQPFCMAFLLYPENTFNNALYSTFEEMSTTQYDELVKNEKDFDAEMHKQLYRKIGGYFIQKEIDKYPLTAFIANNLFYGGKEPYMNSPIIAYPSVAGAFSGVNYAIEKGFAEQYLELKGLQYGTFGGFKDEGFLIHAPKICDVKETGIEWSDFITRIYYDKFGLEYDFVEEKPADLNEKDVMFMQNDKEFNMRALVKDLVDKRGNELMQRVPSSFKYNEICFDRQTQPMGINFPPKSIYVLHKGEKLFLNHVNLHLDYRHEKKAIKNKSGFKLN